MRKHDPAGSSALPPVAWVILVGVVLLGAGLRLYRLDYWSVWTDEGHTFDCARVPLFSAESKEPMARAYPINFYITGVFLKWFGETEVGGRLFPCLMGILTLPLVFLFTRSIHGSWRVALWTTALVAFCSWHIDWSQNARHYGLLFFLVTAMLGFFFLGLERDRWGFLLLSAVCCGLAIFTHPSGAFSLPGVAVYSLFLLWRRKDRPRGRFVRNLLCFWGPPVVGGLVAVTVLQRWGKVFGFVRYLFEEKHPWNPAWNVMGSVVFYLGPALFVLAAAGIALLCTRRDRRGFFLGAVSLSQLGCLTVLSLVTVASGAYNLTALWPLAMGVAWLGVMVREELPSPMRLAGHAVPAAILAVYLGNTALYFAFEEGNRPRWREAFQYIRQNRNPDADVVYCSSGSVGNFYFGYPEDAADRVRWLDSLHPEQARAGRKRLWLLALRSTGNLIGPGSGVDRFLKEECRLQKSFRVNTGIKERNIQVFRYDPPGFAREKETPDPL